ncbi:MAG: uroporphyrinogen-III synthase [Nitratireductor sp.]|nr:uroporphyrinogen-III synthase [Nitratireductor sp.]
MHVMVIREKIASQATARKLRAAGHVPVILPLMQIVPEAGHIPDGQFDAVAFTSAFAPALLRRMEKAAHLVDLPAFCVGPATANAARRVGFADVRACGGSAQTLAAQLIAAFEGKAAHVLYPAAREKAFDLAAAAEDCGLSVMEFVLYAADLVDPGRNALASALERTAGGAVLIHSARSAGHLAHLIEKHDLLPLAASLTFIAISENVAETARRALPAENFEFLVAKLPEEDAMLSLIEN